MTVLIMPAMVLPCFAQEHNCSVTVERLWVVLQGPLSLPRSQNKNDWLLTELSQYPLLLGS
jgi:hypothetical protein